MSEISYYLGIDGGGTKTEFTLCDKNGNILNNCILNGCNPNDTGIDKCIEIINDGVNQVCSSLHFNEISVFAGIAGASASDVSQKIETELTELDFACVKCESDISLSITLTIGNNDGITVIMGTGIVVIIQQDGIRKLIGGYNHFFDKGGSAFNIGRDAICYALMCEERNLPKSLLYTSVLEKCQTDNVRNNIKNFYVKGKQYIAQFSKCVTETLTVDKNSEEILNNNIDCVCDMINFALSHFENKTDVFITGGLTSVREIIEPIIRKKLNGNFNLKFIDKKPVYGALKLAGLEMDLC